MVLPPIHQGSAQAETIPAHGTRPHPDFADMLNAHEWKTQSRRKFPDSGREKEHVQSSYFCGICLARMHTTRRNVALTQAWVRLPGMRECHYLRTENAISPVSDMDFYGTEPLRISQAPSVGRSRAKASQS